MASANPVAPKVEQQAEESKLTTADMTDFVQNLLTQMQSRFQEMSESILAKNELDEMGGRIDELEESINELKAEIGGDSPAAKPTAEEGKPSDESA